MFQKISKIEKKVKIIAIKIFKKPKKHFLNYTPFVGQYQATDWFNV